MYNIYPYSTEDDIDILCQAETAESREDYAMALSLYQILAAKDNAEAICQLAFLNDTGRGIIRDMKRSVEYYARAVKLGHPRSYTTVYYSAPRAKNTIAERIKDQLPLLQLKARKKDRAAAFMLGMCYSRGIVYAKNYEKAVKWLSMSALAGYPKAQLFYGLCLQQGAGIRKDIELALDMYERAASAGEVVAMHVLSGCYMYGSGGRQNLEKAEKLLRLVVKSEHKDAYYNLALLLLRKYGRAREMEALCLLKNAVAKGHEYAPQLLCQIN